MSDLLSGGSSGTSASTSLSPTLPQSVLKKVENDIAKALADNARVSMIIAEAVKRQSSFTVDQRLSYALKEFSKDFKKLATAKELSKDESTILLNIRNKNVLNTISVKIREFSTAKFDHFPHSKALNFQNLQRQRQRSKQTIVNNFLQSEPGAPDKLNKVNEPDIPDSSGESAEFGGSGSSNDDEETTETVKSGKSIENLLIYLRSEKVAEVFEKAVIKHFMPASCESEQVLNIESPTTFLKY